MSKAKGKKKLAASLTTLYTFVHNRLLAKRFGEHWELSETEAKDYGEATEGLLSMLPSGIGDAIAEGIGKSMPVIFFASTVGAGTWDRWERTQLLIQIREERMRLEAAQAAAVNTYGSGYEQGQATDHGDAGSTPNLEPEDSGSEGSNFYGPATDPFADRRSN